MGTERREGEMANFSPNQAMCHEGQGQGKNAKPLRLQGSWVPQRAVVLVELAPGVNQIRAVSA